MRYIFPGFIAPQHQMDIPTMFPQCEPWVNEDTEEVKTLLQCWTDNEQQIKPQAHDVKIIKKHFFNMINQR